jgi:hypothetical protein
VNHGGGLGDIKCGVFGSLGKYLGGLGYNIYTGVETLMGR